MRIPRLLLHNFRSHSETELRLGRITVIRGQNGAGKTSVMQAIEWALCNRVWQLTDEGGRNSERLMTLGASDFSVSLDVFWPEIGEQDAGQIKRARTKAGTGLQIQGPDFGAPDILGDKAEKWIAEQIGHPDQIRVLLNSSRFISMSEKEQAALLIAALSGKSVQVPPEIIAAMRACGGTVISVIANDADAQQIYDEYYKLRTAFNRDVKAIGELKAPEIPADMPDSKSVSAKLAQLRSEREGLVNQRTRLISEAQGKGALDHKARIESLEKERTQAIHDWEIKAAALKNALADIKRHRESILDDAQLEKYQAAIKKTQTYAQLTEEIAAVAKQGDLLDSEICTIKKQLESGQAQCPTCGQSINRDSLLSQISTKKTEYESKESARKKLAEKLDAIGNPDEAKIKIEAHKKAVIAIEPAERTAKELQKLPAKPDTEKIDFNIKQLREMPVQQAEAPDTSELDAKIAEIEDRIRNGEQVQQQVAILEGQKQNYESARRLLQQAREKADKADIVVQALTPGGKLRSELIGDAMEIFSARLIESLKRFDFTCNFSLSPYTFTVESMEISQLCESEKFRFGIAFQIALAEATGIKFVCIDRSDVLVSEAMRGEMAGMLMQSGLDQAIVFFANADPQAPNQLPEGVRFIDLQKVNGKTEVKAVHGAKERELTTSQSQ